MFVFEVVVVVVLPFLVGGCLSRPCCGVPVKGPLLVLHVHRFRNVVAGRRAGIWLCGCARVSHVEALRFVLFFGICCFAKAGVF